LTRAIVTGASGFIGTRLVRRLVAMNTAVVAIDREPPRERLEGVTYITHDIRSPMPSDWAEGCEVIYNLAAVHRTPGHPPHEYYDTNIFGAFNVVRLAEATGIASIVFTSSISVYGPSEEVMTEESPLRPTSDYGRSKRMSELVHEQWMKAGDGRRLVVVRPGVIFGAGERGNYTALARTMRKRIFAYPGRRDTIKSGGYVDELLDAIDFATARAEPYILFNFAYPDFTSTEDIVATFKRVSGFSHAPPTVPLWLMMGAARLFEVTTFFGGKSWINRERVLKLVNSTKVRPGWLIAHGYEFHSNLESALRDWKSETDGAFV
jgi:nucleoside-diphosphate-sugar epimerase